MAVSTFSSTALHTTDFATTCPTAPGMSQERKGERKRERERGTYGFSERVRESNIAGGMASDLLRQCTMLGLIVILMAVPWTTEASLPPEDEEENVLHIGGIFPIAGEGGWQGGQVRVIISFYFETCNS